MKDLVFSGRELSNSSTETIQGEGQNRFNELTLYKTDGGKYIYCNEFITRWQGEKGRTTAQVYDSAEELVNDLTDGDYISDAKKELIIDAASEDVTFDGLIDEVID